MLGETEVENYRKIKAPDELRNKVLKLEDTKKRVSYKSFIPVMVLATTLMLVFITVFNVNKKPLTVDAFVDGKAITEYGVTYECDLTDNNQNGIAFANSRETGTFIFVPVELKVNRDVAVSVAKGIITFDKDDILDGEKELKIGDTKTVWWVIDEITPNESYTMKVKGGNKEYTFILTCDEQAIINIKQQ